MTAIAKQGPILAVGEATFFGAAGLVRIFEADAISGSFELAATFVGGAVDDALGASLALDGDLLVAGAPGEGDCGAVHVYARVVSAAGGASWASIQTIDCPSTTQLDADFGRAVALSGSTLAVGAPLLNRPNPGGGLDFGGVYVFRPEGLLFALDAFLRPAETAAADHFGSSLALYPMDDSPGIALFAGAPGNDVGSDVDSGAAYLYLDWGDGWRIHRTVAMSDAAGKLLGTEVALGRMGVLAGMPGHDGNGVVDQGGVVAWNGIVPLFYDGFDRGDLSAW